MIIIKAVDDPDANDDLDFKEAGGTVDGGHRTSFRHEHDHIYQKPHQKRSDRDFETRS